MNPPQGIICFLLRLLLVGCLAGGFALKSPGQEGNKNDGSAVSRDTQSRVILAGDKLSYRVPEDGDEARILGVSSFGEMEIPYHDGRMVVTNKSLDEVRQEIKRLLEKELYYQATVQLSVVESTARQQAATKPKQITVVGQVRGQGMQEWPPDGITVSQAILKAGGFAAFANKKKVQIIRKKPDGTKDRITVNVDAILKGEGETDKDVPLLPDDMVIVQENRFNVGF